VKTSPSPTKNLILSIIRIRSKIIEKNSSGKNIAKCYSIMKDLKVQIDAYGNRWTNEENLSFLIPENESGKNLKQQLYAL
jgi:hypothetical protein